MMSDLALSISRLQAFRDGLVPDAVIDERGGLTAQDLDCVLAAVSIDDAMLERTARAMIAYDQGLPAITREKFTAPKRQLVDRLWPDWAPRASFVLRAAGLAASCKE